MIPSSASSFVGRKEDEEYVIQRRVERAKLLLSTTNWSLTAIAHTVGFAHESHLALHFKRLTGVTPRYYR
jgi:AraC family transcriptional regulator